MAVYGAFNQGSSPLRLAVRKRPAPRCKGKGHCMYTLSSVHVCTFSVRALVSMCIHETKSNRERERDGWMENERQEGLANKRAEHIRWA